MSLQGGIVIAVLLGIAGLHLYWGLGGFWPGTDSNTLREKVVGTASGAMYGLLPCLMVTGALCAAAAVVAAGHSNLMQGPARFVVASGYVVLILVFAARGLAPYVTSFFEYARGRPFFDLNLWLYAPLCLVIAALLCLDFPRWEKQGQPA